MDEASSPVTLLYSYATEDEALCNELEKHLAILRRAGLIAEWRSRQITAGAELDATVERYLSTAQIILLLISPNFLASDNCYGVEMQRALERHRLGSARVIPIMLRPVDWKGASFAQLSCLPHNAKPVTKWKNRDDAFVDIARGLRDVLEELRSSPRMTSSGAISSSHARQPIWYVPYHRNPFFTGREEILVDLHNDLISRSSVALTQPRAISGLGGIGKTQTANEYAHRCAGEYTAVLWVRAESRDMLLTDYAQIATLLNLPVSNKQDQNNIGEAMKGWLSSHSEWLLIFDNIENLQFVQDFTPSKHQGYILLTTRAQVTEPIAFARSLGKMREAEAAFFVLRRAKIIAPGVALGQASEQDRQLADSIWSEMDGLPLALDQAAAYILETGCSLAHYLKLFRLRKAELLALRGEFDSDHPESVMTTFSLLFDKIEQVNSTATDLLRLCVFLNPDNISESIVAYVFKGCDPLLLDAAKKALLKYSFLYREARSRELTIHRLVQVALRARMDGETYHKWASKSQEAAGSLPDVRDTGRIPPGPYDEPDLKLIAIENELTAYERYLVKDHPHIGSLLDHIDLLQPHKGD